MIPPQEEVDWNKPEHHFAWALRNMPTFAGTGAVTHPGFLTTWSKHLWECGFAHRDYLERLADEDGNIHVSKLPKQLIRWQAPFRGPRSNYNNAARWVSKDTPAPEPVRLPDVSKLTQQEQEFMLGQFRELGLIQDYIPQRDVAQELND
ncbi:minor tail protein [Mycobacterium phage Mundrea]|uniref:Minor tail protein n=1 Tax=Mycobacterium phage Mundrea TaxID=1897540 RepID=A0A1C9LYI2_9CAUD|nr:minor tail protein [Mycobacterium phage Mundrea]AOQ27956.1 minor tail protein [Mycobacterium phage Mundrea]